MVSDCAPFPIECISFFKLCDKKEWSIAKENFKAYQKEWREKNKAHVSQYNKDLYQRKKEIVTAQHQAYYLAHKEHIDDYRREWRRQNPEQGREYSRRYYQMNKEEAHRYDEEYNVKLRAETLAHYGGECACCHEKNDEFLVIDHINGGGNAHRRELGMSKCGGKGFYRWLRDNGWPEGYRVLCHNCNSSLGQHGYCPHAIASGEITLGEALELKKKHRAWRAELVSAGRRRKQNATP